MAEQATCRGCNAPIRFFQIGQKKDGKKIWAICENSPVKVWVAVGNKMVVTEAWIDHHSVCPNAEDFRKPKLVNREQVVGDTGEDLPF